MLAGTAAALALPRIGPAEENGTLQRLRAALDHAAEDPAGALDRLAAFDAARLPLGAQLDLRAARSGLAADLALARRFPFGRPGRSPYLVTPTSGAWSRADAPAAAIENETQRLAAAARSGIVLPQTLLARTLAAVEAATRIATGPRAAALDALTTVLRSQAATAPPPGMSHLPGGMDSFALLLRRNAGDDIDPAQLRRRLEAEEARTLAHAARLFRQIGMRKGSVGERYAALWRDPRWLYVDDDAGRDRAIADMNRMLDAAVPRLQAWFGPLPATAPEVRAARMPPAEAAAGRQGYRVLPEGTRPGRYVVDLKDIRRRPRWTLAAVVHHELLPGHMVQLPIEALAAPHPLRIDYAQAFVEGWAIYAERLAAANGAYRSDPYGALGYCHWRLFRIARALADLGVHLGGWRLDTTLDRWRETLGEPAYFAPFAADLDRIVLEPAVRAGEAAAWLAIEDRSRERRLQPFHHALLAHGRVRTEQLRHLLGGA